jgi:hypothetical protein
VLSMEAGRSVTHDRELAPGWRRVAAVRSGRTLKLYVDGKPAAASTPFDPGAFDLSNTQPLKIGFGDHDYFNGTLRDVRMYSRALSEGELRAVGA